MSIAVKKIIVSLFLLAALLIGLKITLAKAPTDEELIVAALHDAIKASREGRPGGVLEYLAEPFKINDTIPGTKLTIGQFVRDARPKITIDREVPVVNGDLATLESPASADFTYLGNKQNMQFKNVSIEFRKRHTTRFGVIPVTDWEIYEVKVPQEDFGILNMGLWN